MSVCTDRVVGKILAGWRYDISGLAEEMRGDYEQHFAECAHCRSRQRLHRAVDFGLLLLTTISGGVFLLAFIGVRFVLHNPRGALIMEIIAVLGFLLSGLIWVLVAIATPVPVVVADAARLHARKLQDRLPPQLRERLASAMKNS
jgi:hypothetical protein